MKTPSHRTFPQVLFKMRYFCDHLEQIAQLEEALASKPPKLQLNLIGSDDLPPDIALLARSVLGNRSPKTHLVTNARSSLQGGAVLMWLLGDTRLVREDTMLFFRKLHQTKPEDGEEWKRQDSDRPEMELEEVDYAQVLQHINHFLPVNELAGHAVDKETLKQFGLIDNEKADEFLATIFAREGGKPVSVMNAPKHEPRTRVSKNRKAIPRHPTQ